MICGHCKAKHENVAEVRACATGKPVVIQRTPVTEPGMYRLDAANVYQVVWNADETHLYAKLYVPTYDAKGRLHKFEFVYERGSIFNLDAADRMTVDEVAQLGRQTGFCWICHRKLTVQKSIAAGIGPVCAKKV